MTRITTINPDGSVVEHFVITKKPKLSCKITDALIEFNEFLTTNFSSDLSQSCLSETSKIEVWQQIKLKLQKNIRKICLLVGIDFDFDVFFDNYFPVPQKGSPDAVTRMIADLETIVRDNYQD